MLAGESATAIAGDLNLARKLLYRWKDAYLLGGAEALRRRGRPRSDQVLGVQSKPSTERGEALRARQRIAELERKVGRQQLEIDFFVEALRRVKVVQEQEDLRNAQRSTRSSGSKRSKAD